MLSLKDVTIHYGTYEAVRSLSLIVEAGTLTSVIGANGAGKSTILKAISGLLPLKFGEIRFKDRRIDGLPAHEIVRMGISHVPEGRKPFPHMSVLANLKIGGYLRRDRTSITRDLEETFQRFPVLRKRRQQRAGTLSGGEQQMLAIGRSLMARPSLLLMDEPSVGLAPIVIQELATVISDIIKKDISVLLVEQNAGLVTTVSDRGYVLELGSVVLSGDMKDLIDNELVRKAFLGK
jgi:branched-chain amino acid transport system ATP-binding protein